jgi:hypothetical protein
MAVAVSLHTNRNSANWSRLAFLHASRVALFSQSVGNIGSRCIRFRMPLEQFVRLGLYV